MLRGERAESLALIREGLAIAEDFGDPWSVFTCLNALALSERSAGNYVAAETAARRGLALSRAYGSGRAEVWGYMMLGDALKDQGRTEEAVAAYEHCLAHGASDSVVLASSHVELGNVALLRGQHEAARRHFEASLTGFESMGNRWGILLALDGLGRLSCTEGNDEAAVLSLTRALHIGQASRASALALQVVASLALWHARSGRDERAVELLGLVDGHPATEPATRAGRAEPLLAELRERLPPERFDAARARGRELDLFRIGPD